MVLSFILTPLLSCRRQVLSLIGCSVYVLWIVRNELDWALTAGVDTLAALLLVITLGLIAFMVSSRIKRSVAVALRLVLLTLWFMFTSTSLIPFYFWFELSLLPIGALILGWGIQPERLLAGIYMLFYTISASLPFLGAILYWAPVFLTQPLISPAIVPGYLGVVVLLPFCVKLPIFYVHLWLPKAHVEAPVFGSMLLAATLLKIGPYGVWRVSTIVPNPILFTVGVLRALGAAACSWVTLTQTDIKALIAYSSVVHIGAVLACTLFNKSVSMPPALMMIVAHGVCRSGLLYMPTISYEGVSSPCIPVIQGLGLLAPSIRLSWVLLVLANLRSPPTLGLVSEVLMLSALFRIDLMLLGYAAITLVLVLTYSLRLFYLVYHGTPTPSGVYPTNTLSQIFLSYGHAAWFMGWPVTLWLFELF